MAKYKKALCGLQIENNIFPKEEESKVGISTTIIHRNNQQIAKIYPYDEQVRCMSYDQALARVKEITETISLEVERLFFKYKIHETLAANSIITCFAFQYFKEFATIISRFNIKLKSSSNMRPNDWVYVYKNQEKFISEIENVLDADDKKIFFAETLEDSENDKFIGTFIDSDLNNKDLDILCILC